MLSPKLDHLSNTDFAHIYEPAEDSWLLVDALNKDAEFLRQLDPMICVEIGYCSYQIYF